MSDGKSFSPTDETMKSPEERLAEVEKLWPIIIQKLQAYDKIIQNNQTLTDQVQVLSNSLKDAYAKIESVSSDFKNVRSEFDKKDLNQNSKNDCLQSKFDITHGLYSTLKSSVNDIVSRVDGIRLDLNKKIDENFDSSVLKSDLEFLGNNFERKSTEIKNTVQSILSASQGFDSKIKSFEFNMGNLNNKVNELIISIQKNYSDIFLIQSTFKDFESSLDKKIQSQVSIVNQNIDTKISIAKKDFQVAPETLSGLRDELLKKLEAVALDGSNAVLKSNNSSQQILVLEKKIENIFLLLKKHELTQ